MTDSDPRKLHERQALFSRCLAMLITWCFHNGYEVVMGECKRGQVQASANAAAGIGIEHSLHLINLAGDLLLFRGGVYLTDSKDYAAAGAFWKTLDPLCRWGGDFTNPDGDHFSITWQGVR